MQSPCSLGLGLGWDSRRAETIPEMTFAVPPPPSICLRAVAVCGAETGRVANREPGFVMVLSLAAAGLFKTRGVPSAQVGGEEEAEEGGGPIRDGVPAETTTGRGEESEGSETHSPPSLPSLVKEEVGGSNDKASSPSAISIECNTTPPCGRYRRDPNTRFGLPSLRLCARQVVLVRAWCCSQRLVVSTDRRSRDAIPSHGAPRISSHLTSLQPSCPRIITIAHAAPGRTSTWPAICPSPVPSRAP